MSNNPESALDSLRQFVGSDQVIAGDALRAFEFDVYRQGKPLLAVMRPQSEADVQALVRWAAAHGIALLPRGGGASYTDGYLGPHPGCVLVDLGGLNRIVEINSADGFVTVEAGVTWAALKAALDPLGLRTPFVGPFSGLAATVGGSLSQHSISHGSGAHGVSAQSVLSLDVVIADGSILSTGSRARSGPPVQRFDGPDLCGLFLGDCGALGIKLRATLPLIRRQDFVECASFAVDDVGQLAAFMQKVAMARLDDENFAIDAALAQGQISRHDSVKARFAAAQAIIDSAPNKLAGLIELARFGLAGTQGMTQAQFMVHYILDGGSRREVRSKLKNLRTLAAGYAAEIPALAARFVQAVPFAPLFNVLGPKGERWVPLHGVLAPSCVGIFHKELEAIFERHAAEMQRLGVWVGRMFESVGVSGFLYEIAYYWPGPPTPYHQGVLPADYLATLPAYPTSSEAEKLVELLRAEAIDLYQKFHATHFQLGRVYPYLDVLSAPARAAVKAIKAHLDPTGIMNPGVLGL